MNDPISSLERKQRDEQSESDVETVVILHRKKLLKEDSMNKIKGVAEPGSKVRIHWDESVSLEYDEGYIFTTPECRWDEGDVFVHINNSFDGEQEWKHLYELADNVLVTEIEVLK